jgi:hypothetical protein
MTLPYDFKGGRVIHVFFFLAAKDVDGPDKPGHDELESK